MSKQFRKTVVMVIMAMTMMAMSAGITHAAILAATKRIEIGEIRSLFCGVFLC